MAEVNAGTMAKAEAYAAVAEAAGWTPVLTTEGDLITATTTRGSETIMIHWKGTRFVDDATYTNGSQSLTLRNVSAARQKMADSPDVAARGASKAIIGKGKRKVALDDEDEHAVAAKRAQLPFDSNSSDEEVFKALGGKTIVWRNSRTREVERAVVAVNPGEKLLKMDVKGSRRVFSFCSVKGPFRSVYLDAILEVK